MGAQGRRHEGFTKRYKVCRLVYYEVLADPNVAIQREKSLKRWPRDWKTNLIEQENPDWHDLYIEMAADPKKALKILAKRCESDVTGLEAMYERAKPFIVELTR